MFQCKSHPDKLLKDHLLGVHKIGMDIFRKSPLSNNSNIGKCISAVLLFHDFGKTTSYFQEYLELSINFNNGKIEKPDYINALNSYKAKSRHSLISAFLCLFYLSEVLKLPKKLCLFSFYVIKKHHGNLEDYKDIFYRDKLIFDIANKLNFAEINSILDLTGGYKKIDSNAFCSFLRGLYENDINYFRKRFKRQQDEEPVMEDYFFVNFMFSILVSADKGECIMGDGYFSTDAKLIKDDAVDIYKKKFTKNSNPIYSIRNSSYSEIEKTIKNIGKDYNIFSINLPTGAGKTLASLNAALKIREKIKCTNRIIYCLPFTSVIDQNAKVFSEVLKGFKNRSDVFLKHHHLSEIKYLDEETEYDTNQSEYLITDWNSELIITTFFQFLYALLTGDNKDIRKLKSIQNSIVILDEVQAIPHKYWHLVKETFKYLADSYNVKFIFVTATMPLIFDKTEIFELAISKENYFKSLNRINLDTRLLNLKTDLDSFCKILSDDIEENRDKSFLIILNTIKSSIKVFNFLKEKGFEPIYLSKNILPCQILERISSLKENKVKIAVSTQIVEAGVDIDFDVVYRDMAPLDSIFQSCGRCNREGKNKNKGTVKIVNLTDKGRDFCSYIYSSFNINCTKEVFKNKADIIEEKDFPFLSEKYYEIINERKEEDTSKNILDNMKELNYVQAFKSDNCFRLIESIPSVLVFICIDKDAEEIWNEYTTLLNNDTLESYEKHSSLKDIFKRMSEYIINVGLTKKPHEKYKVDKKCDFYYIPHDEVADFYDENTGYISNSNSNSFM